MKPQDGLVILRGLSRMTNAVLGRTGGNLPEQTQELAYKASEMFAGLCSVMTTPPEDKEYKRGSNTTEEKDDLLGFTKAPGSSSSSSSSSISGGGGGGGATAAAAAAESEVLKAKRALMRENAVPSTQFGRMLGFGSLGASLAFGMAGESIAQLTGQRPQGHESGMSDANAEVLAEALCRMRGAALKLGQMLSIQDTDGMLPPALDKALARVRETADYMPVAQLERQLEEQLGADWRDKLQEFDPLPIAAASIGQVHRAVLLDGSEVALKVQYPGVGDSIESDLRNLKLLVTTVNVLPKGMYIDEIIRVAGGELKEECDYVAEAASQSRYKALVAADPVLREHAYVPSVVDDLSSGQVLTSEFVHGIALDKTVGLDQVTRNAIARTVLFLTIKELFEWKFMQTDPNFSNFLYDEDARRINLIDFGASRAYSKPFVDGYMRVVWSAANGDARGLLDASRELGFLTGEEAPEMMQAHVEAGMVVGEPFNTAPGEVFDFAGSKLTQRIGKHGATFVQHRLTPPPPEAYSLHRKLAGAFLLCIKLEAKIPCRDILQMTYDQYTFD